MTKFIPSEAVTPLDLEDKYPYQLCRADAGDIIAEGTMTDRKASSENLSFRGQELDLKWIRKRDQQEELRRMRTRYPLGIEPRHDRLKGRADL